ncbi:MAG: aminotransferase class I/II-fold pyridoxal phosphate-dependent enzyme [Candidatus Eisenbacteria bacterium]
MRNGNERTGRLPVYPFAEVNKARDEAKKAGMDVIDMGVGNPDLRPDQSIIDFLKSALDETERQNHRYPPYDGIMEFREAIADYYKTRFGVELDPGPEVLPLIGSKEGIAKFFLSHMDPGDVAIVTSPCYPAYIGAVGISDADLYELPLYEQNEFRPDLKSIPSDVLDKAAAILINYPNNPTGAVETRKLYQEVLELAQRHDLIVVSDIAYAELNLEPSYKAMSFLELPGAKERAIEFHSFSKTYSMAGWRLGFVVGNAAIVQNILKIKTNMDFGIFMAMQRTGAFVLRAGDALIQPTREIYAKRRDTVVDGFERIGIRATNPLATIYVWAAIPEKYKSSMQFAKDVLTKTGVVFAPGSGFGTYGEGYIRVSLIEDVERIKEAIARIEQSGLL